SPHPLSTPTLREAALLCTSARCTASCDGLVHRLSHAPAILRTALRLFFEPALLGAEHRLAAIESDSLTSRRWLNCNDIPRAHQLRLMSLIVRDSASASSAASYLSNRSTKR